MNSTDRINILVADDEDLIRRALSRVLANKGHQVFSAENGAKALDYINTEKIDLIILDLLMPEKNGFDVLVEMKTVIPVVVISAFSGTNADHFHSDEYPQVVGFIKKPFEHLNHVIEHIEKLYANYIRKV
jgi:DNA-binding response OmpR family regulator